MVILHTFAFPNRIEKVEFISIWNINGNIPVEYYLATFGSICVGMFLFLSGYGLYIQNRDVKDIRNNLKRILKLYINYWVVIAIFIPIGLYMGKYQINIKNLLFTITAIKPGYNAEWWFITLYIMLVLSYPIIIKLTDKFNTTKIVVLSFVINIIAFATTKITYMIEYKNMIVDLINIFLGAQYLFVLGIVVAKYSLFDKLKDRLNISKRGYCLINIIMIISSLIIINIPIIGEIAKLILIPVFIFVLSNVINEESRLSPLGNHSTNIWLTHSFFCYYLFQDVAFIPKYSVLVLAWICILSIGSSFIINNILKHINSILFSKKTEIKLKQ